MLLIRSSIIAALLALFAPVLRADPSVTRDVWHPLTDNSPFFLAGVSGYHGAGLVQKDGLAAVFVLGKDSPGAVVTVSLPASWNMPDSVVSKLHMPGGYFLNRTVSADQMRVEPRPDDTGIELSFAVSEEDIRLFRKGLHWRIEADGKAAVLTLRGSNKAISQALDAKTRGPLKAQTPDATPPSVPVEEPA